MDLSDKMNEIIAINGIEFNNGMYTIAHSELLRCMDNYGSWNYWRGKVHGLCNDCGKMESDRQRSDLIITEIAGKREFCKSCDKLERVLLAKYNMELVRGNVWSTKKSKN